MKPIRVGWREALIALCAALAWAVVVRPGPLSLPYFWDEGDVYAPGARWLALHGFDVTPGHFPDDWSRGHPQLFYLVVAFAFRLFGTSPAVGHAVMLPFTAVALAGTYVLGSERAGRSCGAGAAALLGATPLFMSMGAQTLPEMPLTALTVVALVLFARGQLVGAALAGVALVWIKETGVFTPLALTAAVLVERRWRDAAISASPVLALVAFFVWQRATAGYFVFPHHVGLLTARPFAPPDVLTVFPSLFLWHGRWIATLSALVALALFLAHERKEGRRIRRLDRLESAIVFLALGNAVFFAKMFWLERYALPVHAGICVLLATRWRIPVVVAAAVGILSLHTYTPGAPEQTFGYADVVASHRAAISRVEGAPLVVTVWPLTTELQEPWLGYAHHATRAVHPDHLAVHPRTQVDVVVVDRGSSRAHELAELAVAHGLTRRTTVAVGAAPPLEVWAR